MTEQIPAYKRKIRERQERKTWPSHNEVTAHPNTDTFLQEHNCDPACSHLYECIVVKMKCQPHLRRLWLAWQSGMG